MLIPNAILSSVQQATVRLAIDLRAPQISANQGNSFFSVGAMTDYDMGRWEFVQDVDGKIFGFVSIPTNMNFIATPKIVLVIAANATAGITRLSVATAPITVNESLNPGSLTDETAQDITVPATAYLRKDVEFVLTSGIAAGDVLIVEVYHNGAHGNDTLATNTLLIGAYLEMVVNV